MVSSLYQLREQPKEVDEGVILSQLYDLKKKSSGKDQETPSIVVSKPNNVKSLVASSPLIKINGVSSNKLDSI